jgi:AcrR family transcriptional regulator
LKKRAKRTGYHHGDLRRALIDEALLMLRDVRPEALSMRELARRLGVSLGAPHHHFAEKDELFAAIAQVAFAELAASVAAKFTREPDAVAKLALAAHAYLEFAQAEPMRYRVMYLPQLADRRRFAALHETGGHALSLLSAGFEHAGVPRERAMTRAVACWSALHGFAMLRLDALLPDSGPSVADEVIAVATRP